MPKDVKFFSKKANAYLYRLDVAANIYPALSKKEFNNVYRISFKLNAPIDAEVLKKAVVLLAPRFPAMYVQLYRGFLWNYFRPATDFDIVVKDSGCPCRPFKLYDNEKPLFRIIYDDDNNICAEFFHSVADGVGSFAYLKTLCAKYLEMRGAKIEKSPDLLDYNDEPSPAEHEDAYLRYYNKKGEKSNRREPNAYQAKPAVRNNYLSAVSGRINTDQVKAVAKAHNCSIYELMLAVYGLTLVESKQSVKDSRNKRRPVRICTPINMRQFFETKSLKNFVLITNFDIDLGYTPTTIDEIIPGIQEKSKKFWSKDYLVKSLNRNCQDATMPLTSFSPRVLKIPVIKIAATLFGENKYTTCLTNVGLQKFPKSLEEYITDLNVYVGPTHPNALNCAFMGLKDMVRITITSVSDDITIQNKFFEKLSSLGLDFEVSVRV